MPVIELSDDEAGTLHMALVYAATRFRRCEDNDSDLPSGAASYLSTRADVIDGVVHRLERPQTSLPAPAIDPCTYWVMLGPEGQTAVLVHRKDERDGLIEIGYSVERSARLDTREQALAWFETYYRSQFREPPKEI